jgi:signal transduction histidine kinase
VSVEEVPAGDGAMARLTVSDNGPGIPPEERERVFDRFYRRAGSQPPGSGLGLAIVKAMADAHGAAVQLGDGPSGKGLSVSVLFPAERLSPQANQSRSGAGDPAESINLT